MTGLTLGSSGMVQSYYGSVLEIESSKRFWYLLIGVPLAAGSAYVAFLSLVDYMLSWVMIAVVVIATIGLQILISWVANHLWFQWIPSDDASIID